MKILYYGNNNLSTPYFVYYGNVEGLVSTVERLNLTLSTAALLVSVALAVLGYYWFVPALREYELRGRLEVTGKKVEEPHRTGDPEVSYEVDIVNIGSLPTKEIQLIARYPLLLTTRTIDGQRISIPWDGDPIPKVEAIDPPLPVETSEDGTKIVVRQALSPKEHLRIGFSHTPVTVWVLTDSGDPKVVQTGAKARMFVPEDMAELFEQKKLFEQGRSFTPKRQQSKR